LEGENLEGKDLRYLSARVFHRLGSITAKQYTVAAVAITLIMILFAFKRYLFIVALLGMNIAISTFFRGLKRYNIGIEIVMFSAVMSGVVYGPVTGAVMGALSMVIDYVFATRLSFFSIVTIPSYAAVGYFSPLLLEPLGITKLGIIATVAYVAFTSLLIICFMGGHLSKSIRFGITNIVFNIIVFRTAAPLVLGIMQ